MTGTPNHPSKDRSHGLEDGHAALVIGVLTGIQAAALIGMGAWSFQAAHRGAPADELAVAVFFGLLAFLCLGKLLSSQFLIWVVPLVPVAWITGRRTVAALVEPAREASVTLPL